MGQTWENLLFAHWRVDADALRRVLPDAVRLETHDGAAWLGMTPFRVSALRLRGTLPLPRVSSFLELNVRTYVTAGGKPGIWFFSLDASSRLAVEAARRTYKLPYFQARIRAEPQGEWLEYESARIGNGQGPHVFDARYRPSGEVFAARPDRARSSSRSATASTPSTSAGGSTARRSTTRRGRSSERRRRSSSTRWLLGTCLFRMSSRSSTSRASRTS